MINEKYLDYVYNNSNYCTNYDQSQLLTYNSNNMSDIYTLDRMKRDILFRVNSYSLFNSILIILIIIFLILIMYLVGSRINVKNVNNTNVK